VLSLFWVASLLRPWDDGLALVDLWDSA